MYEMTYDTLDEALTACQYADALRLEWTLCIRHVPDPRPANKDRMRRIYVLKIVIPAPPDDGTQA